MFNQERTLLNQEAAMVVFVSTEDPLGYGVSGGVYDMDAFFMGTRVHVPYTLLDFGSGMRLGVVGAPYTCRHEDGHPGWRGWFESDHYDLPNEVVKAAETHHDCQPQVKRRPPKRAA